MSTRTRRRMGVLFGAVALAVTGQFAAGTSASAHPLGNLSVNQYHGLTVRPDRVDDLAVLDLAEIPTLQDRARVDADHDGTASEAELAAYAGAACVPVARDLRLTVDGRPAAFSVVSARAEQPRGSGGLPTTRVECRLTAPAALDREARISLTNGHLADRVGWREITAVGDGVVLPADGVARAGTSNELRTYPTDLLTSPLNIRSLDMTTHPGTDTAPATSAAAPDSPLPEFVEDAYAAVQRTFNNLIGADRVTLGAGLAAVALALLLGASHAALPGHGKTVMAAYLALRGADGRRQGVRDAVTVGATVTLTHTAGVLVLGLALTASASLTGETAIAYLGAVSGVLVMAVGVSLLRAAFRGDGHGHAHPHEHTHPHEPTTARTTRTNGHSHPLAPDRHSGWAVALVGRRAEEAGSRGRLAAGADSHLRHGAATLSTPRAARADVPGAAVSAPGAEAHDGSATRSRTALATPHRDSTDHVASDREHDLLTASASPADHDARSLGPDRRVEFAGRQGGVDVSAAVPPSPDSVAAPRAVRDASSAPPRVHTRRRDHVRKPAPGHTHAPRRRLLIGMGVAGGLVPSPSALVVLLGAIALGRTAFGVLLVLAYGLGMASVLTAAGLLLVRVRERVRVQPRFARLARPVLRRAPVVTAAFVVVVGLVLAWRGLTSPAAFG